MPTEAKAQELLTKIKVLAVRVEQWDAKSAERETLIANEGAKCRSYLHDLALALESGDQAAEKKVRAALEACQQQIRAWEHDVQSFAEHKELARRDLNELQPLYQAAAKREAEESHRKRTEETKQHLANQSNIACEAYKEFVKALAVHVLLQEHARRELGDAGNQMASTESMRLFDAIAIPDRLERLGWKTPSGLGYSAWMGNCRVRAMCTEEVQRSILGV